MRRPAFWIVLALLSAGSVLAAVRYFPQAFSIVALDITMDRGHALAAARALAARDGLGPPDAREAASFSGDDEAQTFVELEGGGKSAFARMLRERLYAAYTWKVRHFKQGETNETTIRFTPDGRPYGFSERVKEDAPGAALDAAAARPIADAGAAKWNVDLARFRMVEQGQERRPSGRIDHTFTYERTDATLNEGRYRLRVVVSGDRVTEVTHFIKIPEAFTRRYEKMRSANELIGIGSVVGMALLYVLGGIGVGLFFMMRRRWILWRTAAVWGLVVGGMQTLASINEFPLLWMRYDTALPTSTFLAQQIVGLVAGFVGFSAFFALSFMAAETLTRRAFGQHPQLWQVWSKDEGASIQILGRTVGGYLLVPAFFAYDVLLYVVMTKNFHWWSPAEALLHPDVLATYAPWLSAIANSFQAGFWEESMFRAIPIAGAALIGDRLGRRRLFIVLAFVVEAVIFGSGHAPYPNQPAYARPVELIIPSIGFGLLYLYFGLLPGIILHFTFDVTWFALPVFFAHAPGVRFQQLMIVAWTLVPLWVVFWRRSRAGRWTELAPSAYNAAWTPPPAEEADVPEVVPQGALTARVRKAWMVAGGLSIVAVVATIALGGRENSYGGLQVSRASAEAVARTTLDARGVSLPPKWRVMATPDAGGGGAQQFVYDTAGRARWRDLLGRYLATPRWRVRVATFTGDISETAEEWYVYVNGRGGVQNVQHVLPEARAGASLDEASARERALAAVQDRYGLEPSQVKEVSARPEKQRARTDWTFTLADTTIPPLPQGEPRIDVKLAGDEIASTGRYVFIPETWQRDERAASTRNLVIQVSGSLLFGGLLVAAAISGMLGWSRHQSALRLFLAATALVFLVSALTAVNNVPAVMALLRTAVPLQVQLLGLAAASIVGFTLLAAVVGLAVVAIPAPRETLGRVPDRDGVPMALAAGAVAAAAALAASLVRTPEWARVPAFDPLGAYVPIGQMAISPIAGLMARLAVLTTTFAYLTRLTSGWTKRRGFAMLVLAVMGLLSAGAPAGTHVTGWLLSGMITASALVLVYAGLLRFDVTLVPLALGVMSAVALLARGAARPFPGALVGSILGAALSLLVGYWWFRVLRPTEAAGDAGAPGSAPQTRPRD